MIVGSGSYAILKLHFDDAVESPAKENVLRDWVNEVCPIYGVLDTADTLHYYIGRHGYA